MVSQHNQRFTTEEVVHMTLPVYLGWSQLSLLSWLFAQVDFVTLLQYALPSFSSM
jgi:hypothetical protein